LGQLSVDLIGKSLPLPTIYSLNKPLKEVLPVLLLKQGNVTLKMMFKFFIE